jgi:feruloyl esterase
MITRAVLNACRAYNGSRDGGLPTDDFLNDPEDCDFEPASIQCQAGDGPDCLTTPQVTALRSMYDGADNPRTGQRIYFGWPRGSENSGRMLPNLPGWSLYWANPKDPMQPARVSFWRYWVFGDPNWSWWSFDFDRDMAAADEKLAPVINAMSPDLQRFRERGGKMIHNHGLADPVVPYMDSISYHERVVAQRVRQSGGSVDLEQATRDIAEFYRLFLVPGMEHCRGGAGPDAFDALGALERWVEDGIAPDRIVATKFVGEGADRRAALTRPLCPFPGRARYRGSGDPNDATTFDCIADGGHPQWPALGSDYIR